MTASEQDGFIAKVVEHLADMDPLSQVVIKCHLLLEDRFNSILRNSIYNPEVLDKFSLTFAQKMHLVRGFCISQRGPGMWELLSAMNALRNALAHSLDAVQRQKKFEVVKQFYLRELENPELKKQDEDQPEHLLFMMAYALCEGFIKRVDEDAAMVGGGVKAMIKVMRKELYEPETKAPESTV
jgi:hypothetical protein